MKFWAAEEAINYVKVPSEVSDLVDITLGVVSTMGGEHTRLVRIGQNDGGLEDERFQVDLELAPGVVLPTMLGSVDGVANGWDDPLEDEDRLSDLLEEGLAACLPVLNELADKLHDARLRARRVLADWNAAGIPTRLMDVRLAQYDYWRGISEPALLITVETLDDALQPVGFDVLVESSDRLNVELEEWRDHVGRPYERRTFLAAKGATGTIDQLGLNLLALVGDVADSLRDLANEQNFRCSGDTGIVTVNGHVSAGTSGSDDQLQINGDYITIPTIFVPAEQLREAVGRPVSWLINYDFLSDDITVAEASCLIRDGLPTLTIRINNPKRLFCSASGRVWDDVGAISTAGIDSDQNASGAVVPFRRRRG